MCQHDQALLQEHVKWRFLSFHSWLRLVPGVHLRHQIARRGIKTGPFTCTLVPSYIKPTARRQHPSSLEIFVKAMEGSLYLPYLLTQVTAGGSLSNTLLALARLGAAGAVSGAPGLRVAMGGVLGSDPLGSFYAAQMRQAGVTIVTQPKPGTNTGAKACKWGCGSALQTAPEK